MENARAGSTCSGHLSGAVRVDLRGGPHWTGGRAERRASWSRSQCTRVVTGGQVQVTGEMSTVGARVADSTAARSTRTIVLFHTRPSDMSQWVYCSQLPRTLTLAPSPCAAHAELSSCPLLLPSRSHHLLRTSLVIRYIRCTSPEASLHLQPIFQHSPLPQARMMCS
jgi:hypothetical protein